ncbi:MAG: hypothetical protein GXY47_11610 [Acidobacteria bacterium]|nr:hypothetical protein [Acidobacteriota bacterium]
MTHNARALMFPTGVRVAVVIEKAEVRGSAAGRTRLVATLSGDRPGELFFEVEERLARHFRPGRADCFVAALLPESAMHGIDIVSRVPVGERLLFQLNTFLCPVLATVYGARTIKITAPLAAENTAAAGAVGTGITCGVDSLYTVARYSHTSFPRHDLTHLCLFNVGSHHIGADDPEELEEFRTDLARRFCTEYGYEFLSVESNVHEFAPRYARYYSVLNAAAALSLPGLFTRYYSSSGYALAGFSLSAVDLAHFETFILDALSTGTLGFYSTGSERSRLEKVRTLVDYAPSHRYLNVCNTRRRNCGVCVKCLRTLYALDILGALDRYGEVFDLDRYRRRHSRHLAECWVRKVLARDSYCREMWPGLRKKYGFPWTRVLQEIFRFIRSRLGIYSWSVIRHRLRGR